MFSRNISPFPSFPWDCFSYNFSFLVPDKRKTTWKIINSVMLWNKAGWRVRGSESQELFPTPSTISPYKTSASCLPTILALTTDAVYKSLELSWLLERFMSPAPLWSRFVPARRHVSLPYYHKPYPHYQTMVVSFPFSVIAQRLKALPSGTSLFLPQASAPASGSVRLVFFPQFFFRISSLFLDNVPRRRTSSRLQCGKFYSLCLFRKRSANKDSRRLVGYRDLIEELEKYLQTF